MTFVNCDQSSLGLPATMVECTRLANWESSFQNQKKPCRTLRAAPTIDSTADSIKIYSGVHSLISDRLFSIRAAAAVQLHEAEAHRPTEEIAWHDQMSIGGGEPRRGS